MQLILNEFENLSSNDIIAKNARYDAIVDLTDPNPPSIDISTDDEWTPQLIAGLTFSMEQRLNGAETSSLQFFLKL